MGAAGRQVARQVNRSERGQLSGAPDGHGFQKPGDVAQVILAGAGRQTGDIFEVSPVRLEDSLRSSGCMFVHAPSMSATAPEAKGGGNPPIHDLLIMWR